MTIAGLRIADGTAPSGGANPEFGGDIFNGGATLTLADDVITGGTARVGGGVDSEKEDAPLVVRDSTVAANKAEFGGGISAGRSAGSWTILKLSFLWSAAFVTDSRVSPCRADTMMRARSG